MELNQALMYLSEHLPLHGFVSWSDGWVNRHRRAYEHVATTVRRLLPSGSSVLDFGGGIGDKTAVLQLLGYRCAIADDFQNPIFQNPEFRRRVSEFARNAGLTVHEGAGSAALAGMNESFDLVMAHDVIEHLHDSPRELLNDLLETLKPGGYLFITVPSAVNLRKRLAVLFGHSNLPRYDTFYWFPGPWRGHVREYTKGDLRAMGRFLGLEEIELHACHHMLSIVPGWIRPLYLAATAVVPGWRDSWCYVGRKGEGWTAQRTVDEERLKSILVHLSR